MTEKGAGTRVSSWYCNITSLRAEAENESALKETLAKESGRARCGSVGRAASEPAKNVGSPLGEQQIRPSERSLLQLG
jgi:hypothetical protein